MKNTLLIFCVLSLSACGLNMVAGVSDAVNRPYQCHDGEVEGPGVINGPRILSNTPLGHGVVFLTHQDPSEPDLMELCTGSLIGDNMVMTAAHCVGSTYETGHDTNMKVYFDNDPLCSLTKNKTEKIRISEKVVINPEYLTSATHSGDIALIRFADRKPDAAVALKVARSFVNVGNDQSIFAAGYGRTVEWNQDGSQAPFLRLAQIKMLSGGSTSNILNTATSKQLIFDQRGDQSLCQGDSGGPAMAFDDGALKVIGVASFVDDPLNRATCRSFVVHTSVAFFNDWLASTYDSLATADSSANPFRMPGATGAGASRVADPSRADAGQDTH